MKNIQNIFNRKKRGLAPSKVEGFTLIESLVAISILVAVITGTTKAIQTGISSYIFSKDQIIAFYLAQEGFEQIRNIRDENSLNNRNWLTGLSAVSSDPCWFGPSPAQKACRVAPADPVNGNVAIECGAPGSCPVLLQNVSSGFFGYGYNDISWKATVFKREIMLTQINSDEISVSVTVNWSKGIVNRQFK